MSKLFISNNRSFAPTLVMVPSRLSLWASVNSSISLNTSKPIQTIYLEFGRPAPFSLAPCSSLAAAKISDAFACAAAAWDYTSGDLNSNITITDVSPYGINPTVCMPFQLTLGTCLPGQYTLEYSVTSASSGLSSTAFLLVCVEIYTVTNFSYTFMPSNIRLVD